MTKKDIALITLSVVCCCLSGNAQSGEIAKGDQLFDAFDYKDALYFYETANDLQPGNPDITRRIANTYRRMGELSMSAEWYRRTLEADSSRTEDLLYYAESLKTIKEYEAAIEWYEKYSSKNPADKRAKSHTRQPYYYEDLIMDSLKYDMKKLSINNQEPAIGVCLFEDEKIIIAAVNIDQPASNTNIIEEVQPYLDLFLCTADPEMELKESIRMPSQVNSKFHDGPAYYNFKDRKLYITRNNVRNGKPVRDKNGAVNLKIYESTFNGTSWSNAQELKFNSDEYSNAHPCISKDGNTMYFVSNRPDGFGGTDIYMCTRLGGEWSEPSNLGSQINTEGNEMFPFLSADGKLYFSSDGHAGLGGLDIFYSSKKDGTWSTPTNMGVPVNGNHDDFSVLFDSERESGYFCSDRSGSGNDDVFSFRIIQLEQMILAGSIKTSLPQIKIANERILIRSSLHDNPIEQSLDENGDFIYHAQPGERIEVLMANETLFSRDSVLFVGQAGNPIRDPFVNMGEAFADAVRLPDSGTGALTSLLQREASGSNRNDNLVASPPKPTLDPSKPIETFVPSDQSSLTNVAQKLTETDSNTNTGNAENKSGSSMKMYTEPGRYTIHFGFNKSIVTQDARNTLDEAIQAMKDNPDLNVMIETHCDSRGNTEYNTVLSMDRAYAVKKYFMRSGISVRRIGIDWLGENKLANHCKNGVKCTSQEHLANRRAEITLTSDRIAQFPSGK
jgi:outer membrane protein OmpA-like peptidoglycan-associated protein/tetratricopeptide (TPR) repeat protein